MSQPMPGKPRPEMTEDSRPYWEGLKRHKLLLQRCGACGRLRHYPRPLCDACHSFTCEWVEASGDARVHSWMVAHHPFHPSFRDDLPYTLVTADLAEGVRLLAPLHDARSEMLRPGRRLRVDFEDVDLDLTLPVFRLAPDEV
jgi:uncharacterized protein